MTAALLRIDQPQPGYYKTRLVKGGPFVAVRIWWQPPLDPWTGEELDRGPTLMAEVNGRPRDPYDIWTWCADKPVDFAEYHRLRAAAPTAADQPINVNATKPVF